QLVERFPVLERLRPYQSQITSRVADIAGKAGTYLAGSLSSLAGGTVRFIFNLFVMLYAMFCFLIDGRALLGRILDYMPLPEDDKRRLLALFLSVTRAMLKGTFIVGIIQGALGGLSFAVAGIEGSALWATVMAACSIIPGVGAAIVWVPAVIYLGLTGHWVAAIGVTIWCAAVVGSIDNVLRPRLVGRDISMPSLLIFLATLGGVSLFGAVGLLFGPIIAALFQSVWEMYGHAISGVSRLPPETPTAT
ncbi:MAG TPA: AI-2E family transporter, partial [Patescibacteria group bacterium]|nr:AI-2E family transporter [Patescibacteria group bacterium]